jgi:hypothetical protein
MKRKAMKDHIEKPEDKIWQQWFNKLTPKDHDNYMAKLGLTEEDKAELPEIEEQLHSVEGKSPEEIKAMPEEKNSRKRK